MSDVWTVLAAGGFGVLSSLIPLFNAELYTVAMAKLASGPVATLGVVALAFGTMLGKIFLFEAARRGSTRFGIGSVADRTHSATSARAGSGRMRGWFAGMNRVLIGWLGDSRLGPLTTLAASVFGVPPLFIVAVLAGVARQNIVLFSLAVLLGRLARFAVVAWPFMTALH